MRWSHLKSSRFRNVSCLLAPIDRALSTPHAIFDFRHVTDVVNVEKDDAETSNILTGTARGHFFRLHRCTSTTRRP